jgi:SMI1 / KNR4 family (SUKH-1)
MDKHQLIAQSLKGIYAKNYSSSSVSKIAGCSDVEIQEIELKYNIKFPRSYYIFLKEFGKSPSGLLGCMDIEYPCSLTQTEEFMNFMLLPEEGESNWIPPVNIPDKMFVIANYYWDQIWFFIADGSSDDPPIFIAESGQGNGEVFKFEKVCDSIWNIIEDVANAKRS